MNSKLLVAILAIVIVAGIGIGAYAMLFNGNGNGDDDKQETPSDPGVDVPSDPGVDVPSDPDEPGISTDDYKTFEFGKPGVGDWITAEVTSPIPKRTWKSGSLSLR